MPHLTIEYSQNLELTADMDAFCALLNKELLETGLFELGALRVRAIAASHYAIADQLPENCFVDMNLRIGTGRTEQEKRQVGERLMETAMSYFSHDLTETQHFALSLEIREISPTLSWRKNAIHSRLRKALGVE